MPAAGSGATDLVRQPDLVHEKGDGLTAAPQLEGRLDLKAGSLGGYLALTAPLCA